MITANKLSAYKKLSKISVWYSKSTKNYNTNNNVERNDYIYKNKIVYALIKYHLARFFKNNSNKEIRERDINYFDLYIFKLQQC